MQLSRRKFLKAGALCAFISLWTLIVPHVCNAPPSLSFHGKPHGNGLLNGLVAYWKMDDAGNGPRIDATGNGWTLTDSNSLIGSVSGLINACADGSVDAGFAAILGSASTIDTRANTTPFTISLWVNDAGNAGNILYLCLMTRPTASDWWVQETDSTGGGIGSVRYLSGFAKDGSGTTISTSRIGPIPCCNSFWTHVVFGFDGAKIFLVVNNSAPVTANTTTVKRDSYPIDFFNFSGAVTTPWLGRIDEVAFYNRALTSTDIGNLFNNGNGLPLTAFTR